jgi:hypothetical protein
LFGLDRVPNETLQGNCGDAYKCTGGLITAGRTCDRYAHAPHRIVQAITQLRLDADYRNQRACRLRGGQKTKEAKRTPQAQIAGSSRMGKMQMTIGAIALHAGLKEF